MGCTSSNLKNQKDFVLKPSHPRDFQIQTKLLPILDLNHASNINSKYIHIMEIHPKNQSGLFIFRTNEYKSKIDKKELEKKRLEFWETRTEGKKNSWESLKKSIIFKDEGFLKRKKYFGIV